MYCEDRENELALRFRDQAEAEGRYYRDQSCHMSHDTFCALPENTVNTICPVRCDCTISFAASYHNRTRDTLQFDNFHTYYHIMNPSNRTAIVSIRSNDTHNDHGMCQNAQISTFQKDQHAGSLDTLYWPHCEQIESLMYTFWLTP